MSTTQIVNQIKAARRVSAPLIAIKTPDPAATVQAVCEGINGHAVKLQWDVVSGLRALTENAVSLVAELKGDYDPTQGNPAEALTVAQKLPDDAVFFIHNAPRFLSEPSVMQAAWNLRELFKGNHRTLIMLGVDFQLPAELQQDVLLLDEPLPNAEELAAIVREQYESADLEADDATVARAVEAVQGLAAFPAEQVTAMSLRREGLDVDALWERKRQMIEQTPGLKVSRGGETFKDIGGVQNAKDFLGRVMKGNARPNAVVFIDEIEKAMAGTTGDTSGVSQDQLGVLLSYMQDNAAAGCIFVGPPGCLSGETVMRYNRGKRNSGRTITLERLYQKFNNLPVSGGRGEVMPWHDKSCATRLHSYDHESGRVFYNEIEAIYQAGVKSCITLETSDGEYITLTIDHPILTPDGFVDAGSVNVGDEVICRGSMKPTVRPYRAPKKGQ